MKHQHLQHLLLVPTLLEIVEVLTGAMSPMTVRGSGGVGGNTACATAGDIGEELRGQRTTVPIWWSYSRCGRRLVGPNHRWCSSLFVLLATCETQCGPFF